MPRALLIVGLLLLCSLTMLGQTFGTITGVATDPTGAVVPNARVTVTNTATNASRNTVTNSEGIYAFPSLVPGPYEVRIEAAGFRTATAKLELQVQQTARVDFKLEVGATTESIEVSAAAALLACAPKPGRRACANRLATRLPYAKEAPSAPFLIQVPG